MNGDLMIVSSDKNVQGDLYIESDADEIYLPDTKIIPRAGSGFKNNMPSLLPSEDEGGIVGYQKYMHVINRKAVDNSDNYEPLKPELSHFLRVSEAEFA